MDTFLVESIKVVEDTSPRKNTCTLCAKAASDLSSTCNDDNEFN